MRKDSKSGNNDACSQTQDRILWKKLRHILWLAAGGWWLVSCRVSLITVVSPKTARQNYRNIIAQFARPRIVSYYPDEATADTGTVRRGKNPMEKRDRTSPERHATRGDLKLPNRMPDSVSPCRSGTDAPSPGLARPGQFFIPYTSPIRFRRAHSRVSTERNAIRIGQLNWVDRLRVMRTDSGRGWLSTRTSSSRSRSWASGR